MNEHKSVPNIRFNGFENKWEKKQLNQIVKKVTRKNSKLQTDLSLTISADRGIINQNLFFNRQIASRDMSNYFLIKQGEFAYNKSYSKSAPFGTIKRLNRYNQGALSSLYIVFCPTKANSDYLVSYFDSSYWYKQLSMISTEGVRNHGLLNVSSNDFFDMNLSIPHDDKEQQKIGEFFAKLDKLLVLQQQKINKFDLLKKALLQKLFPKHDAKIPELRFKGFEDEWKSYLLGKIAVFINGRAFKQNELLDKGKYRVLRVGNFYTNDKWFYSDLELPEKLYANKGDLLYTWSATFGPHIWTGDKVIYHYHIWKIIFLSEVSKQFALQMLLNDKDEIMNNTNGSTMIHLTKNEMEKKVVKIPIKSEQQKIGNLLSKVDQLIELENKKLHNLQQVKKCLLQNMFVE